jgi:UDP-N-acetyl-D-galactosamine dehydrogenase
MADSEDAENIFGIYLSPWDAMTDLDAMILAVGHHAYRQTHLGEFIKCLNTNGCITDIKSILDVSEVRKAGIHYWRL